uniref:Uncharacterized protein n=1 Tax=Callithrix jacchus TaxID=9483 RepID=A0A8I3WRW0_CALJA
MLKFGYVLSQGWRLSHFNGQILINFHYLFLLLVASFQKGTCQMPARAILYEVSVSPCVSQSRYTRVREPLDEAVCPLSGIKCCAGRSAAPFRAARQERLSLLRLYSQLPLSPGALSQEGGGFIYKSLTGCCLFSEMPCPAGGSLVI